MKNLVLGSSSPFRKELLSKLGLPFETDSPDIDETPLENESPQDMVKRLAKLKAEAIAAKHSNCIVIASDQCATLDGKIIGKPLEHDKAVEQLQEASGRAVTYYTALCVMDTASQRVEEVTEPFHVYFRELSDTQIENYLKKEEPYQCAGSIKSESLGIALFERLEGSDPNTLIGLPMIQLVKILEKLGIDIL